MSELREYFAALMAAIARNDNAAVDALIDPDFLMYEDEGMPYGGTYRGVEGFRQVQQAVFSTWRDHRIEMLHLLDDDEGHICVTFKLSGFLGAGPDRVETIVSELWTIRDGMAVEARLWYYDTPRLAALMKTG